MHWSEIAFPDEASCKSKWKEFRDNQGVECSKCGCTEHYWKQDKEKLRSIMGKRDENYTLSGIIELDEGFFSTEISEEEKEKPLKRGRGSQKKVRFL